mmetsp:Transcript_15727/g.49223  ORF Transcript_15727/g.49223 Transcript_15727/m.49223 type:complete len:221 (-) Transcript_15727:146-808(-)
MSVSPTKRRAGLLVVVLEEEEDEGGVRRGAAWAAFSSAAMARKEPWALLPLALGGSGEASAAAVETWTVSKPASFAAGGSGRTSGVAPSFEASEARQRAIFAASPSSTSRVSKTLVTPRPRQAWMKRPMFSRRLNGCVVPRWHSPAIEPGRSASSASHSASPSRTASTRLPETSRPSTFESQATAACGRNGGALFFLLNKQRFHHNVRVVVSQWKVKSFR